MEGVFFHPTNKTLMRLKVLDKLETIANRRYFGDALKEIWKVDKIYPAELAKKLNCAKDTAINTLKDLESLGLVERIENKNSRRMYFKPLSGLAFIPKVMPEAMALNEIPPAFYESVLKLASKPKILEPYFNDGINCLIVPGSINSPRAIHSGLDYCAACSILLNFVGQHAFSLVEDVIAEDMAVMASPVKSKQNLIAIGSTNVNNIVRMVTDEYKNEAKEMPVFFEGEEVNIVVKEKEQKKMYHAGDVYARYHGMICEVTSPFNRSRKILLVGGHHREGTLLATHALITGLWKEQYKAAVFNRAPDGKIIAEKIILK